EQLYLTEMALDYFEKADNEISSEKADKNYSYIVDMLKAYLQIDPKNIIVDDTLNWAESTFEIKTDIVNTNNIDNNKKITKGQEAADLIIKAADYFKKEDYFSALYYANLAFDLDNSRHEAQRIAAESRDAIRSLEPDSSERDAKIYFEQKRLGFNTLNEGNPIDAYYIFKKLSVESNKDKDIPEFLNRSLEEISRISFFIDEAEKYLTIPGIDDIVFLNNQKTLIYIDKMIMLDENKAYFFNIEVINWDSSNKISKHYTAPYGKYNSKSESIIMNAIDRDISNRSYKPLYITGADIEPENLILKLSPNLIDLNYLGQSFNSIRFMNIIELFNYGSIFNSYGYIKEPAQILLLERIAKPFTFLIISFLSVSLGWFLRIRKYTFPLFALLLIPIIAYLINNILSIYEFGVNLILGYSLFMTGFYPALIILIVSQAIILFFSLVSIASQKD
ncbi:MAG: LptF/LptG family permease, partial [Spirochaetales bacterium]|nr:LptF/LptG family permease [Spirochaetales bacterium]